MSLFKKALMSFPKNKKTTIDHSMLLSHILRAIVLTFASSINNDDHLVYFQHIVHGMDPNVWKGGTWDVFTSTPFSDEKRENDISLSYKQSNGQYLLEFLKNNCPWMVKEVYDSSQWEKWLSDCDPFSNIPTNVSDEERLLLVKTFRPDCLNDSVTRYCCNKIGIESLSPLSETLSQHWNEYLKDLPVPVMLVTPPGSDPGNEIQALAAVLQCRSVNILNRKLILSLTRGGSVDIFLTFFSFVKIH